MAKNYTLLPGRLELVWADEADDTVTFAADDPLAPVQIRVFGQRIGVLASSEWFVHMDEVVNSILLCGESVEFEPATSPLQVWSAAASRIPVRLLVGLVCRALTPGRARITYVLEALSALPMEEWERIDRERGLLERPVKFLLLCAKQPLSIHDQAAFALAAGQANVDVSYEDTLSVQTSMFEKYLSLDYNLNLILWGMEIRYQNVQARILETGTLVSTVTSADELNRLLSAENLG